MLIDITKLPVCEIKETFKNTTGYDLLVYNGLRTLEEQAKIYRKSRTTKEINDKQDMLIKDGYYILADVLEKVGKQTGKLGDHKTYAAPGESWHNYNEAFDAVPTLEGNPLWNYKKHKSLWDTLGEISIEFKLIWGGSWKFKDYTHFQTKIETNPLKILPPYKVKDKFERLGFI